MNLIAETVNISVFIEKTAEGRKITQMVAVEGCNQKTKQYKTQEL